MELLEENLLQQVINISFNQFLFKSLVDLLGKVEQTTHMDLNNDGKIGGAIRK